MLRAWTADLHIHTCLSPCADLTMSPPRIVAAALEKGLDMIGICDHNSAENVEAVMRAAPDRLKVLAGMEITTSEEIHVLALFEQPRQAERLQRRVYEWLPAEPNDPEVFGEQIIANEHDEVEGYCDRLLFGAVAENLDTVVRTIRELAGLAIAAHVDRPSYSLLSQLGFIPASPVFDALEISPIRSASQARRLFPELKDRPLVSGSDAHVLTEIGQKNTRFLMAEPSLSEISRALARLEDRKILDEESY